MQCISSLYDDKQMIKALFKHILNFGLENYTKFLWWCGFHAKQCSLAKPKVFSVDQILT